ncbi:glutaminase [Neolewinella aurantiaca]|uniref:Glutaminase n=1 Tax=Neolewinella aurantiaca TaxID=2602767 RepID=A0A5C7FBP1_9BACT|nr:glutaminase [Neolewinella aurantiaca]TXF88163.1 glutaminase [Neolewinella aurantiaca]
MNVNDLLAKLHANLPAENTGVVASYIPELAHVDPTKFGVHAVTVDQREFCFGDSDEGFSIQSIAKVLSLTMAYQRENQKLWKRVDVEPSGTPFNSLIQLEQDKGIPRNPMINAGALVVCDVLLDYLAEPRKDLLAFVHSLSGDDSIGVNERVAASERETSARNRALIEFMRSFGNIRNDTERILDFYCSLCAIEMTCSQLSRTFLFLANQGVSPFTGERIVSTSMTKRLNAIMQLCGLYDEAGEFAFRVGLPGKSGVGGGIVALRPRDYCVAVWSPPLNYKGNSHFGMAFLEGFTSEVGDSIY